MDASSHHHLLLIIGLLGLIGVLSGELFHRLKVPAVSAYLLIGILAGPSVLGWIDHEAITALEPIHHLALGLIAVTVGLEFEWHHIRQLGRSVVLITLAQGVAALVLVAGGVGLLTGDWPLALVLGSIATATAPAATFLTIAEYEADGPLCQTTKMVVALDDALGIVLFALALTAAQLISGGSEAGDTVASLVEAAREVFGSIAAGIAIGWLSSTLSRKLRRWSIPLLLGGVLLAVGLSEPLHLSPLLSCMALGAVVVNTNARATHELEGLQHVFDVVYIVFFALAGASLHLQHLGSVGLLGAAYVVLRMAGKAGGSSLGAWLVGAPSPVVRYLGLTLMPQAGVAVGMAMITQFRLPAVAQTVSTVVLAGVVLFELLGPIATRFAIVRAGEVGASPERRTTSGFF